MLGEGGWGSREEDERRGRKKRVLVAVAARVPGGCLETVGLRGICRTKMLDAGKVRTFEEMMRGRGRGG